MDNTKELVKSLFSKKLSYNEKQIVAKSLINRKKSVVKHIVKNMPMFLNIEDALLLIQIMEAIGQYNKEFVCSFSKELQDFHNKQKGFFTSLEYRNEIKRALPLIFQAFERYLIKCGSSSINSFYNLYLKGEIPNIAEIILQQFKDVLHNQVLKDILSSKKSLINTSKEDEYIKKIKLLIFWNEKSITYLVLEDLQYYVEQFSQKKLKPSDISESHYLISILEHLYRFKVVEASEPLFKLYKHIEVYSSSKQYKDTTKFLCNKILIVLSSVKGTCLEKILELVSEKINEFFKEGNTSTDSDLLLQVTQELRTEILDSNVFIDKLLSILAMYNLEDVKPFFKILFERESDEIRMFFFKHIERQELPIHTKIKLFDLIKIFRPQNMINDLMKIILTNENKQIRLKSLKTLLCYYPTNEILDFYISLLSTEDDDLKIMSMKNVIASIEKHKENIIAYLLDKSYDKKLISELHNPNLSTTMKELIIHVLVSMKYDPEKLFSLLLSLVKEANFDFDFALRYITRSEWIRKPEAINLILELFTSKEPCSKTKDLVNRLFKMIVNQNVSIPSSVAKLINLERVNSFIRTNKNKEEVITLLLSFLEKLTSTNLFDILEFIIWEDYSPKIKINALRILVSYNIEHDRILKVLTDLLSTGNEELLSLTVEYIVKLMKKVGLNSFKKILSPYCHKKMLDFLKTSKHYKERLTLASKLIEMNIPGVKLQEVMAHIDAEVLHHYTHEERGRISKSTTPRHIDTEEKLRDPFIIVEDF